MDEETLTRLAAEALIQEAKHGAMRADVMGPSGWVKPKDTVNKRFLRSTIRNVILSNKHRQKKQDKISEKSKKDKTSSNNKNSSNTKNKQ